MLDKIHCIDKHYCGGQILGLGEILFKAIPHKDRLTALRTSCLQLFRHIAPNHLEIQQYSCGVLIQSDEKSDSAIRTQSLCGIALNYVGNELTGVIVQVLWFTVNELIIIQITASFSYMLIHHKKGFKRFFSFLHFKYFKFNLKVLFTYALFWGVCTFAVNDLRFSHSFSRQGRFIFYLIAAFLLALNALKMIFSYFRAENPSESLSKITKIFFGFLNKNFRSVFTFLIKLCPWIAGYIFLIVIFNRTDLEMVIYVMLNSSMYGLGVLFFPYYFLNFQKMAVRFS